ncbi:DUF2127 domain-containing protein [Sphingomonas hankyongi]|uniref:DUF2127 domain-containing protein n=1 Tax=Sphingomonas hankyongi TaxID=2908209 RepID=A0ABT0S1U8_9SPHN|nr:DUF2127 domain-containing protein [Sphingomonas hankyongi]MCL6729839.1 DUF2127 domain-containing protein [Sphingomonas hankyongi]
MREKRVHQVFVLSLLLKGVNALLEMAAGVSLLLVKTDTIIRVLNRYSLDHLAQDRNDWVANHLLEFTRHFSVAEHHFYAFYLLSHGLIKSVVLVGLLREKLWSYPASFAVFGTFIAYQLYRYTYTQDIGLILLSVFDLFVIALAAHEYRLVRRHLPTH